VRRRARDGAAHALHDGFTDLLNVLYPLLQAQFALAQVEFKRLGELRGTQAISGTGPLIVTSTVRDTRYQRVLASENIEATHAYSLHTTGYTFDIERDYASGRQARAFQFLLDRLTALDLIAWVREPAAIHITVAVATYALWSWLAAVSWRRFGARLPGSFSRRHRQLGTVVFGGLCFTAASATGIFALAFVL